MDKKTLYIACAIYNEVSTIEVDSETKDCVYINGRRTFKVSNHQLISSSRKKAVQFLIDKWEAEVHRYERNLSEQRAKLDKAKALLNE